MPRRPTHTSRAKRPDNRACSTPCSTPKHLPHPNPRTRSGSDALQRAQRVWQVRVLGGSWDQAAQVTGYTDKSNCYRAVANAFGDVPQPDREGLRRLWRTG
jgi:hypothetical protein